MDMQTLYWRFCPLLLIPASGFIAALMGGSTFDFQVFHLWQLLVGHESLATELLASIRLPRALIASLIGAGLAIAGVLMQGITRNLLASPTLFGINAGAACFLVSSQALSLPFLSNLPLLSAALGACSAGALVFVLGSGGTGRLHPTRLVLAGIAVNMLFLAITRTFLILDEQSQSTIIWLSGSLADLEWSHVRSLGPPLFIGTVGAILIGPKLNLLSLGDEASTSLGVSVASVRLFAAMVVILLAGVSVSVSGPISFIGLIVPHAARSLIGHDHRFLIPAAAILGSGFLCWADYLSRLLQYPTETPVGIVLALIGAPVFIWLSRQRSTC